MSNRILIVRLGALGDIVHALPVASALRQTFPQARIDWVVDERHRDIIDLVPVIDRRLVFNSQRVAAWRGAVEVIRELRRGRYDVAIDVQGLVKSAFLARASRAVRVIGFPRAHLRERAARFFYTETHDPGDARHVIEKNLRLLAPVGVPSHKIEFPIEARPSASSAVVRRELGLGESACFALLNPGAAWPNKRWPPERFGAVALWLHRQHALPSAVLWGPGGEHLAADVAAASAGTAHLAPPTSIADLVGTGPGRDPDGLGRHRSASHRGGGRHTGRGDLRSDERGAKWAVVERGRDGVAIRRVRMPPSPAVSCEPLVHR